MHVLSCMLQIGHIILHCCTASDCYQVFGVIYFLVVLKLIFLFSCWLLAMGPAQPLQASSTSDPIHVVPSIFKPVRPC